MAKPKTAARNGNKIKALSLSSSEEEDTLEKVVKKNWLEMSAAVGTQNQWQ